MGLIQVAQHTDGDLLAWSKLEAGDAAMSKTRRLKTVSIQALECITEFRPDYVSVSWGKDSVVVAHLAHGLMEIGAIESVPLVWVRIRERENPFCHLVRDAFLDRWPCEYLEIEVDPSGGEDPLSSAHDGFREASERFGSKRLSGIRAQESRDRRQRVARGLVFGSSCAPIGWWKMSDVFAYLWAHDLPVHPVYAMSFGGSISRDSIRTASVGGIRGVGMGRREWEERYLHPAMGGTV